MGLLRKIDPTTGKLEYSRPYGLAVLQLTQQTREAQETQPKVIAAIPCFNTEPFIADVVSRARRI